MAVAAFSRWLPPTRSASSRVHLVPRIAHMFVFGAAALALSCGASIQAVYEGDVRFEHCMALDSRADVKPTLRRACWEEWEKFYTFGQTRDRVDYAELRRQQLSIVSDFDEGDWANTKAKSAAVPDPTSALAPPPMMLASDAGAAPQTVDAGSDAGDSAKGATSSDCADSCEESRKLCAEPCKTPVCEKQCVSGYKRCMKRCP